MINTLRRYLRIYGAKAVMVPKLYMAYRIWVWMEFVVQTIALIIFVSFWTAVYARNDTISGLELGQTLDYIILAQVFAPAVTSLNTIFYFGRLMSEGQIGIELLRPMDFQLSTYVHSLAEMLTALVTQLPIALIGWLLFRYHIPLNPLLWLAFLVTLLLGNALLFCFDWMLGCISFYSTETWGLGMLRHGVAVFFSGALVPIAMMPRWLQVIATILPFSHALYTPVSLLSGITPLSAMPRIWLTQLAALLVLIVVSRWIFNVAVRKVTIQGG